MMLRRAVFFVRLLLPFLLYALLGEQTVSTTWAFTPLVKTTTTPTRTVTSTSTSSPHQRTSPVISSVIVLNAGGFEWEDPTDEALDQGVDNPFKNPDLLNKIEEGSSDDDDKKTIDPARLLGARLQGSNLYLVGMMGSGKSAVGDKLARRMGSYKFLDTDEIIEKATSMSIPEIFESEGEDGFRDVESQVLDTVHSYVRCIVSTGGGLVNKIENWGKLQSGIVIWLDVSPEIIMTRIKDDTNRPLLQTDNPLQTLTDLLEERTPKYSQADFRVEITKDMDEDMVASQIVRDLHDYIDENPPAWKLAKQKAQEEGLDWVK